MVAQKERTFIMIKPDGVQRGLVGRIVNRFEDKGFKLVALKMVWVSSIFFFQNNRKNRFDSDFAKKSHSNDSILEKVMTFLHQF